MYLPTYLYEKIKYFVFCLFLYKLNHSLLLVCDFLFSFICLRALSYHPGYLIYVILLTLSVFTSLYWWKCRWFPGFFFFFCFLFTFTAIAALATLVWAPESLSHLYFRISDIHPPPQAYGPKYILWSFRIPWKTIQPFGIFGAFNNNSGSRYW